jgi:hypothetical protein
MFIWALKKLGLFDIIRSVVRGRGSGVRDLGIYWIFKERADGWRVRSLLEGGAQMFRNKSSILDARYS